MEKDRLIKRLIALVKTEADKEEDLVESRIRNTTLFQLVDSKYDNANSLLKEALKTSEWYERIRAAMVEEWKTKGKKRGNIKRDKLDEKLLFYVQIQSDYRYLYDKCIWRYGKEPLLELAREVINDR